MPSEVPGKQVSNSRPVARQPAAPAPAKSKTATPPAKTDKSKVQVNKAKNLGQSPGDVPSDPKASKGLVSLQGKSATTITGANQSAPTTDKTPRNEDRPVPQKVSQGLQSEDKAVRRESFAYLQERAAKGDQTAMELIRKTATESKIYGADKEALETLLAGEKFFKEGDYKLLTQKGLTISDSQVKEKVREALAEAVKKKKPGVADGLREFVSKGGHYGTAALEPLTRGLGEDISEGDYKLISSKLNDLELYAPSAHRAIQDAVKNNKGGVRQELDRLLSTEKSNDYNLEYRQKAALKYQAEGQEGYQPPKALFDNLQKQYEKKGEAPDLLGEAFAVSSRPEELGAYSHMLIGERFMPHEARAKVLKAAEARLKEGGMEPLEAARKHLSRDNPRAQEDGLAVGVYQLAADKLKKEDIDILGKLMKERGEQSGVDGGDLAKTLGMAGQHAEGKNLEAIRAHLREGLTHKDSRVQDDVIDAMGLMSENLGQEELTLLSDRVGEHGALRVLKKSSETMSEENKQAVLAKMRDGLKEERKPWHKTSAAELMEHMAGDLSPQDIAALKESALKTKGDGFKRDSDDKALLGALRKAKNPQSKVAAAEALLEVHGRSKLDDATVRELTKVVAASGDEKLKAKLRSQLKTPPLTEDNLKALGDDYQKKLGERIKQAQLRIKNGGALLKGDRSLDELGKLMAAMQMANDPKNDYSSQIDKKKVNARIKEVMGRDDVKRAFEEVRKEAIRDTMPHLIEKGDRSWKPKVKDPAQAQKDYVLSPDFEARLMLASPEEKEKLMGNELTKLGSLDPAKAKEAAQALETRAKVESVKENPLQYIQSLPPEEQEKALESLMGAAGMGKKGPTLAKHLSAALRKIDVASLKGKDEASVIIKTLQSLQGKPGVPDSVINKAVKGIKGMDARGGFGSAMGTFAVGSLLMRGWPKTWEDGLRSGADVLEITSHTSDYAKLTKLSDKLSDVGKFAKFAKFAKVLGPVGDMVSVPLDVRGSYMDFESGDYVGGWSKAVGATAGAVSLAAGLAALSPAAGPGAPLVLGAALIVGVGATVVDWIWGKDPTEQMLINLGVAKD